MKNLNKKLLKNIIAIVGFVIINFFSAPAHADCNATDKICVLNEILELSKNIEDSAWRDKSLRELAKAYTHEGQEDKAISLIDKIEKPDTKAMTIRGIGMAAADNHWDNKDRYNNLFKNLAAEAEKIKHPPSYAIAYTYIAMAQAFAHDDEGAMATAKTMKNQALRNKAYGETAEIQAERGDLNAAMLSIAAIDDLSYRNKAYGNVADIFTKTGKLQDAYVSAHKIENTYAKTQALQKIANYGNKEEMLKE